MKRREFGQLIEVLRHQTAYTRHNNKPFTQKEMADRLNISLRNYGRIERGEVVNIESEVLEGLATLLGLTARERYPFFLAASGISRYAVPSDSEQLAQLKEMLHTRVREAIFPTYVFDPFGNILLASASAFALLGLDPQSFRALKYQNILWGAIMLDRHHAFAQENLILSDIATVGQIRYTSLRHRATPFGRMLFEDFSQFQEFRVAWQIVSNRKGMDFSDGRAFEQYHPTLGRTLKYNIFLSRSITQWGDLYIQTFSPLDRETIEGFALLRNSHSPVPILLELYSTWPQLDSSSRNLNELE